MGGRGVYVGGDNTQIKMEAYVCQQEVECVKIEWETEREKRREERGEKTQNGNGGVGGQTMKKRCACCLQYTLPAYSEYEECPVCGWIDDPQQNRNITLAQGSNPTSLEEARQRWKEHLHKETSNTAETVNE